MRTAFEIAGFTLLATALLVPPFALRPPQDGASAQGAGGDDLASMEASTAALAAMVEDWQRPPEAVQEVAAPAPRQAPDSAPVQAPAPPEAAPAQMALPALPGLPDTELVALPDAPPEPPSPPETKIDVPLPMALTDPPPPPPELVTSTDPQPEPSVPGIRPPPRPERREAEAPQQARQGTGRADSARQRAAGSGGGAVAGTSGTAEAATNTRAQASALATWGASIRARIERQKRYPAAAGRSTGAVRLRISVSSAGTLAGAQVARSSGNAALDGAALDAVRRARFPSAPAGLPAGTHSFALLVNFSR